MNTFRLVCMLCDGTRLAVAPTLGPSPPRQGGRRFQLSTARSLAWLQSGPPGSALRYRPSGPVTAQRLTAAKAGGKPRGLFGTMAPTAPPHSGSPPMTRLALAPAFPIGLIFGHRVLTGKNEWPGVDKSGRESTIVPPHFQIRLLSKRLKK